jgi:hypothetical protein
MPAVHHCLLLLAVQWLSSKDDYELELMAGEEVRDVVCSYRCELQTSDLRRAGTTGHVYLTVIGEHERIGECWEALQGPAERGGYARPARCSTGHGRCRRGGLGHMYGLCLSTAPAS